MKFSSWGQRILAGVETGTMENGRNIPRKFVIMRNSLISRAGRRHLSQNLAESPPVQLGARDLLLSDARSADTGSIEIHVLGEIHAREGTQLEKAVSIDLGIYDGAGRLVAMAGHGIFADTFFGFETFHLECEVMKEQLARLRLKTTHAY